VSHAVAQAAAPPAASGTGGRRHAGATWPPAACQDSIAARVARLPPDSVSEADRAHAKAARDACEMALAAPPESAANPASANPTASFLIAGAVILALLLFL